MVTIQICIGSACHLKGSYKVINRLQDEINARDLADRVAIKPTFCLGECAHAVSVRFEGEDEVHSVSPDSASDFFNEQVLSRLG